MPFDVDIDGKKYSIKDIRPSLYNHVTNMIMLITKIHVPEDGKIHEPEEFGKKQDAIFLAVWKNAKVKKLINPQPEENDTETKLALIDAIYQKVMDEDKETRNLLMSSQKKS